MYKSKDHSEAIVQDILYKCKLFKKMLYKLSNIYVFENWETDFFFVGNDYSTWELEIKVDKQDYDRDVINKPKKHTLLQEVFENNNPNKYFIPNFFYYCAPEGMIPIDSLPPYAGLIELDSDNNPIFKTEVIKVHDKIYKDRLHDTILKKFYNKTLKDEKEFLDFKIKYDRAKTEDQKNETIKKFIKKKRI